MFFSFVIEEYIYIYFGAFYVIYAYFEFFIERTYSEPRKWMRGKGRVTIQFGCCYNYAVVNFSLFSPQISSQIL